jgi:hypothetical protein
MSRQKKISIGKKKDATRHRQLPLSYQRRVDHLIRQHQFLSLSDQWGSFASSPECTTISSKCRMLSHTNVDKIISKRNANGSKMYCLIELELPIIRLVPHHEHRDRSEGPILHGDLSRRAHTSGSHHKRQKQSDRSNWTS